MKTRSIRRLAAVAAGAWITLLATGVLAPASARAACTDYVHAHGREPLALYDLEPLTAALSYAAEGPAHTPFDRPSPCSGMSCSRNPMPPMAPAHADPLRIEAWACWNAVLQPVGSQSAGSLREPSAGRPVHFGFPPDRPPRFV